MGDCSGSVGGGRGGGGGGGVVVVVVVVVVAHTHTSCRPKKETEKFMSFFVWIRTRECFGQHMYTPSPASSPSFLLKQLRHRYRHRFHPSCTSLTPTTLTKITRTTTLHTIH
jgi:hypothetical protein